MVLPRANLSLVVYWRPLLVIIAFGVLEETYREADGVPLDVVAAMLVIVSDEIQTAVIHDCAVAGLHPLCESSR